MVTPIEQQVAALVAVVSISLIGVQFTVIKKVWQLFEQRCLALPREKRKNIAVTALWILLPIFFMEGIFIYSRVYVSEEYTDDVAIFLLLLFSLIFLIITLVLWIVRKVRKQSVQKADNAGLYSFISMIMYLMSIFCSIFALIGVSGTMLNVKVGPYGPQNYLFGKWILTSAITFFFGWMIFHLVAFLEDYRRKRMGRNH